MIEVHELTKEYDDLRRGRFVAVDRVSFQVAPGEIFGLLGPNGAGKTTVLRMLSTVLEPSSGRALIGGYDCAKQPAAVRRNIGFVSNNTAIYDRMNARETVEYFGRLHGMKGALLERRMDELFEQMQMEDFSDTPGSKMSTGMKQKVSIARALIHDPPVLIFDEPTLGLDVLVARSLQKVIRGLREDGKCIIFSTHIMREVERLCDRIGIMHQGHLLDTGSLQDLTTRHDEEDLEELFFGLLTAGRSDRDSSGENGESIAGRQGRLKAECDELTDEVVA